MKIAIMTDVNAGLDYVGYDTGITCLRSTVNFKNEVLVDGIDIKADEFYRRISQITNASDIPSTSALLWAIYMMQSIISLNKDIRT